MSERMSKIWRTLSFRKKSKSKHRQDTAAAGGGKPLHWQEDERKVRDGSCSFQVKYLGCMEVFESRGMQVCEEAIKNSIKVKSKHHKRAVLYVNGDALRVVDEITKGLIVDQTIEKVSFCAPDRNHEKGFAYICRDGATRRWMCHSFLAVKESGERLSHAVGCAFAICLERKQDREKESVQVQFNDKGTSFERMGSFRQTTMTERKLDPQCAILPDPVPLTQRPEARVDSRTAVPRPQGNQQLVFERQASLRLFPKLETGAAFKDRATAGYSSLRMTAGEAQLARTGLAARSAAAAAAANPGRLDSVIPEVSPSMEQLHSGGQQLPGEQLLLEAVVEEPSSAANSYNPFLPIQPQQQQQQQQQQQPVLSVNWSNSRLPSNPDSRLNSNNNYSQQHQQQQRQQQQFDPFDVAWADRASRASQPSSTNPFLQQQQLQQQQPHSKAFEVHM